MGIHALRSILGLGLCVLAGAAAAVPVSFPGTNTGAIPDDNGATSRVVSFAVSGLAGPIASVELSTDLTHTWAGDVTATLVAPNGVARLVLIGRAGTGRGSNFGDSSNLGATYVFSDLGRPDLLPALQGLDTNGVLPAGTFRPISRGAPGRSNAGGCPTSLRGVFAGLSAADANGTWTLVVTDSISGDAGSVGTTTLTLDALGPNIFGDGFETAPAAAPEAMAPNGITAPAHCINKVQADFTGDGLTDYALARANGSNIDWVIRENLGNGTAAATETTFSLGNPSSDFIDSLDLDGDRIADPAVWTQGAAGVARFQVRLSSRNGAVREVVFGQTGDDPTQSGDFDGDAIDDVGVHRAPPFGNPAGPLQVLYLRSSNGAVGTVATGTGVNGDQFAISGFDYTGDGLADVVVQERDATTPTNARFRYFNGLTGAQTTTFVFGLSSDFLIPGNHVGSAWADVTTSRTVSGNREWRTRDSQTGVEAPLVTFSVTGDTRIGGDYDGDGLSDHAFFRPTAAPGPIGFQVRPSTNTATTWSVNFGQNNDFPIAASRVH
jgi:hypothetical protein